jgi:transposase-like protein
MTIYDVQPQKIDKIKLMQMVQDKVSKAQMAREFGCTEASVRKAIQRLESQHHEFDPALVKSELASGTIDTMQQLSQMNASVLDELRRVKKYIDREDKDFSDYEQLEARVKREPGNTKLAEMLKAKGVITYANVLKLQSNVIAIAAEVRKQLEMQLKLAEAMYSVQMVAEFQEEVISILKETDDLFDTRMKDEVIRRLKERRSIRGLLRQVTYDKKG